MAIENGSLTDADEVMNAMGSNFNDTAQMIFNASYIGFDSDLGSNGDPQLKNIELDILKSDSTNDYTLGNMYYDQVSFYYFPADVIDNTNDGSMDATIWTKTGDGSISEGTTTIPWDSELKLKLDGPNLDGRLDMNGASAPNLKDADSSIYLKVHYDSNQAPTSKTGYIYLTDGTNLVTIWTETATGSDDVRNSKLYRLDIDVSAETVDVYEDGILTASGTDISSLTGSNWYLRFRVKSGGASTPIVEAGIVYIAQVTSATTSIDYVSTDMSVTQTITNAILVVNAVQSANPDLTYFLSADGTNWESVIPNEIHRFINPGTTLKVKVTCDVDKQIDIFDYYKLTEYAVKYNFY